jgi:glycosyltransferase involved in cell wall biosynthesis
VPGEQGPAEPMRVAILATGWAGFNDAACRLLVERGVELLVVYEGDSPDTAYSTHTVHEYATEHCWHGEPAAGEVTAVLRDFRPDAVLMHSWHYRPYRDAVKALPPGTLRVLWMDNVWRSTPKQWLGRAAAPAWVRPLFDAVMVPSDRTEFFARRLGFGEADVVRGSLSADTTLFGSPPRPGAELASRRTFLACLRLVHHKGADVLADAYRRYRAATDDPWSLKVAGLGEMAPHLDGIEGVELLGFRQPPEVADLMRSASCLVVPSRIDPFGVVVHEGAVSGLPIVTTYQVGAAPAYVQDGQNGWVVASGDAAALATAMARASALDEARLGAMSDVSRALGARTSSAGWAQNLHEQLQWRVAAQRATKM